MRRPALHAQALLDRRVEIRPADIRFAGGRGSAADFRVRGGFGQVRHRAIQGSTFGES